MRKQEPDNGRICMQIAFRYVLGESHVESGGKAPPEQEFRDDSLIHTFINIKCFIPIWQTCSRAFRGPRSG